MSGTEDKPEIELDCRVSNPELWERYIAMKKQSNKNFYVPDGWCASEAYIKANFPELALDTSKQLI